MRLGVGVEQWICDQWLQGIITCDLVLRNVCVRRLLMHISVCEKRVLYVIAVSEVII